MVCQWKWFFLQKAKRFKQRFLISSECSLKLVKKLASCSSLCWYWNWAIGHCNSKVWVCWNQQREDVGDQGGSSGLQGPQQVMAGVFTLLTISNNWYFFRPPAGCLQYFTGNTGQMTTFNWLADVDTQSHLQYQEYEPCYIPHCTRYWLNTSVVDYFAVTIFAFGKMWDTAAFNIPLVPWVAPQMVLA